EKQVRDSSRVTTLQDADVACTLNADVNALNSPILVLDSNFAQAGEKPVDQAAINTVTMTKCSGGQPGVIVTRTYKDGRDPVLETKCAAAAPEDVTDLVVGTQMVPDWKERLSRGDLNARKNFSCLVTDQGCEPIEPRDLGRTIVCDDDDTPQELVANPGSFDKDAKAFLPQPGPEDCGHGWQGDVIARHKQKDCRSQRQGEHAERPALVMDVAYVGAECEKSVKTEDTCPAQANNPTGRMINGYNIHMTDPVAAVPHFDTNTGQNISDIAWNDGAQTNVNDPEISTLIAAPQTVLYAETRTLGPNGPKIGTGKIIQKTKDLFTVGQDLNKITTNERFDTSMVKELQIANKWGQGQDVECFVKSQTCVGGDPPEVIAV